MPPDRPRDPDPDPNVALNMRVRQSKRDDYDRAALAAGSVMPSGLPNRTAWILATLDRAAARLLRKRGADQ